MSIDTTLRLNDGMTGVINSMISALSAFTSGLHNVQSVLGNNIDTRMFDEAVRSGQEALSRMALVEKQAQQTQRAFQWQNTGVNKVFQNTGIERLNFEMKSMISLTEGISREQARLQEQANKTNILSGHAVSDMNHAQQRLTAFVQSINTLSNQDMSIFNENQVSAMNTAIEKMRELEKEILNTYSSMQKNFQSGNLAGLNADLANLNQQMQQGEMLKRGIDEMSNQAKNFTWNSSNFQIFNSDGLERSKQEILSAKNLSEKLIQTQQKLTEKSANMKLITPNAVTDITNLNNRIANIGNTINNLERQKNKLSRFNTAGIDKYNAQIESIRRSLSAILDEQERWNSAIQSNNIQQVNDSYQKLYNLINGIEGEIRNNTEAQNQFNQSLARSDTAANGLLNKLKSMVGVYATMRGMKKSISLSDSLAQTTARLNLINDGLQTTEELQKKIFASAERSRASYFDTADAVAKFGLRAGKIFKSSDEVIAFSELLNKTFTIAGTAQQEMTGATLQLTQALGGGILRGQEFNSVSQAAPAILDAIANYLNVDKGALKDMAAQGKISAQILKNAMFEAAEDINNQFKVIPITFAQAMTSIKNYALITFQPILQQMNDFLNSEVGKSAINGIKSSIYGLGDTVSMVFKVIQKFITVLVNGASSVVPIVIGVIGSFIIFNTVLSTINKAIALYTTISTMAKAATSLYTESTLSATAAQYGLNTAIMVSPIGMLVTIISALLSAYAVWYTSTYGLQQAISSLGNIISSVFKFVVEVIQTALNIMLFLAPIAIGVGAAWLTFTAIMTAFRAKTLLAEAAQKGLALATKIAAGAQAFFNNTLKSNPIVFVISLIICIITALAAFGEATNGVREIFAKAFGFIVDVAEKAVNFIIRRINNFIDAINKVSSCVSSLLGTEGKQISRIEYQADFEDFKNAGQDFIRTVTLDDILKNITPEIEDPMKGIMDEIDLSNFGDVASDVADTADNTGALKDSVDRTEEDLKYMRDLADMEQVNRFTTAEIKIDMTNNNNINNGNDWDGLLTSLSEKITEFAQNSAEGVYDVV